MSDSADIEIVEFDLDQLDEFGAVDPEPEWIFGQSSEKESGVPLGYVSDAVLLTDGRVAIIDEQAQEVLVFDPRIGESFRLGRKGDGPGEFRHIRSLASWRDGIGVFDGRQGRWTQFTDSVVADIWSVPAVRPEGPPVLDAVLPDHEGFYIADAYSPPGTPGDLVHRGEVLVAWSEGDRLDTIGVFPADVGLDKITGMSLFPFGARFGLAVGDSGLWVGDTGVRQIVLWSRSGTARRIVRWRSHEDLTLTKRRIDEALDYFSAGRPREARASMRQQWRATEFPSHLPAWGTLVRGLDGTVWISGYAGPEAEFRFGEPRPARLWWGIGPDGRPLGTLHTPEALTVTGFGPDYLIGVRRDEFGAQTVRRHTIARGK